MRWDRLENRIESALVLNRERVERPPTLTVKLPVVKWWAVGREYGTTKSSAKRWRLNEGSTARASMNSLHFHLPGMAGPSASPS